MNNKTPAWIEISICINAEITAQLEEAFTHSGALAITYQDSEDNPIFEPEIGETPLWSSTQMSALYAFPADIDEIISNVQREYFKQIKTDHPFPPWQIKKIEDQDWEKVWLDNFKPLQFDENFWIIPSWMDAPDPSSPHMILDPGLAFGTGTHETTALCISWLSKHRDLLETTGNHLIDYGCGSGILAVASAILGAKNVTAIDIDPQAIIATRHNSELNGLSHEQIKTLLFQAKPTSVEKNISQIREKIEQSDIIIANILCEPLIQLAQLFESLLKSNGVIVLSGILTTQVDEVKDAYQQWVAFEPTQIKGDWALLAGTKKTD